MLVCPFCGNSDLDVDNDDNWICPYCDEYGFEPIDEEEIVFEDEEFYIEEEY